MIILGLSSSSTSVDVMGMSTIESISLSIVVGCILFYLATVVVAVAVMQLHSDPFLSSQKSLLLLLRGVNADDPLDGQKRRSGLLQ